MGGYMDCIGIKQTKIETPLFLDFTRGDALHTGQRPGQTLHFNVRQRDPDITFRFVLYELSDSQSGIILLALLAPYGWALNNQ
jgi:hypothetical protein